ncbi:MAG: hypothetical protein AAF559_13460 [Pseudomonadota bacterium]
MNSSVQSPHPPEPGSSLSDQPDFFGAVDDGFAVFCREPPSAKPIELLGAEVVSAIENGLDRSQLRSPFGAREKTATGIVAVAVISAFAFPPGFIWALAPISLATAGLWLLKPWLNSIFVWNSARREASSEELQALTTDDRQRAFVRALEEYRRLLSDDPTRLSSETRNASEPKLSDSEVRALKADHGRQLLISSDRTGWSLVQPPLPRGRLMVSLRGARSKSLLSSKLLMLEGDEALFETRMQWILTQAHMIDKGSKALINGLSHVRYLRTKRLAGFALKDVIDELDTETGLKGEMAQKLWSGNHADFEKALKKLPLESMP